MKHDILSMSIEEVRRLAADTGHPPYRGEQIFEWLHKRGAAFLPFEQMHNLPKDLREKLAQTAFISPFREVTRQVSKDGTEKFLYALGESPAAAPPSDAVLIESVLMRYRHGNTLCISTQAGCRMGCRFCASAIGGLVRNLTAGEMCAQVYAAGQPVTNSYRLTEDTHQSLTNRKQLPAVNSIVLMGCGEPLDNFPAVLRFIELITHPKGANIGARHITLSTCGLVPEIRQLADMKLQIGLAVSLHGATDEIRRQFMPIANRYPLDELLAACKYYTDLTRRRITFEYALAAGINDAPEQARQLAELLRGMLCHVNLIPINKKGRERSHFSPAPRKSVDGFAAILQEEKIPVTVRRSLGADIMAACGQLRAGK